MFVRVCTESLCSIRCPGSHTTYAIEDEYDDYDRHEESDGKVVTGSYHVVQG